MSIVSTDLLEDIFLWLRAHEITCYHTNMGEKSTAEEVKGEVLFPSQAKQLPFKMCAIRSTAF